MVKVSRSVICPVRSPALFVIDFTSKEANHCLSNDENLRKYNIEYRFSNKKFLRL